MTVKNTQVLILCAGKGTHWGNYLGVPKQLISINGESLLERMVRLLHAQGYYDIEIISHDERLLLSNCGFFRPSRFRWTVESLLSTHPLWKNKTLVLLGDIFFTEQAINTITNSNQGIHIYGRPGGPSWYTFKYAEIYALSFDRNDWNEIIAHARNVVCDARLGGRGKLWEFYRSLAGYALDEHKTESTIFIPINDFTDDIDTPDEYKRIIGRYTYADSTDRYKKISALLWGRANISIISYYLRKYLKSITKWRK